MPSLESCFLWVAHCYRPCHLEEHMVKVILLFVPLSLRAYLFACCGDKTISSLVLDPRLLLIHPNVQNYQ